MPEQRLPTLADAQRQARWRSVIAGLLVGLSVIFLLLVLVKHVYQTTINLPMPWEADLRRAIDAFLLNWPMLAPLWRAIPPSAPDHWHTDHRHVGLCVCPLGCRSGEWYRCMATLVSSQAPCADHGISPGDATRKARQNILYLSAQ